MRYSVLTWINIRSPLTLPAHEERPYYVWKICLFFTSGWGHLCQVQSHHPSNKFYQILFGADMSPAWSNPYPRICTENPEGGLQMENKMKLQFACSLIFSKNSKFSNVISCYRSFTVLIFLQRLFCQPTAAGYTNYTAALCCVCVVLDRQKLTVCMIKTTIWHRPSCCHFVEPLRKKWKPIYSNLTG